MDDIKHIIVDLKTATETSSRQTVEKTSKVPSKRKITATKKWPFSEEDLIPVKQLSYVEQLYTDNIVDTDACSTLRRHIREKISGYRSQDIKKDILDEESIVDVPTAITLLYTSKTICYYCNNPVRVLYENVRESCQWSLDRIDNSIGHNKTNLLIACLECNLRRKTMYHERYAFTKQLNIVKK